MNKVYIIAEAGVNHNGSLKNALKLVESAKQMGADAVKFQVFRASSLVTSYAKKAEYQKKDSKFNETQLEMLSKLELSKDELHKLQIFSKKKKIDFLCSAFDNESLSLISDSINISKLKIASGEITNGPFLLAHALTGKDIILSTGMSTTKEIIYALGVIAYGLINKKKKIKNKIQDSEFKKSFNSNIGQKLIKKKVTLLHCTSAYPTPIDQVNLSAINTLKNKFNTKVGYSDHTDGIFVSIMAAGIGAVVIEKHFTLSKDLKGPDHKMSLNPLEFKDMVEKIRLVEKIIGDGKKKVQKSEKKNIKVSRKSIVAKKMIKKNDIFSKENLTLKRPGSGESPMKMWKLIGTRSKKNYKIDDLI